MKNLIKILFVLSFLLPLCVQGQAVTWQKEFFDSVSSFSEGNAAIQLFDEGYIVVSGRSSSILGIVAMRIDKYGNLIWRKYYSGFNPQTIVKTLDNNFLIGGNTLIKIDINGVIIWSRAISIYNIILTKDGGFYSCGSNYYPNLRKYDSLGFLIWEKIYENINRGGFSNCILNRESDIVLIGNFSSSNLLYDYPFIMKTDSLGKILWIKKYEIDSLKFFYLNNINENDKGNYIASGSNYKCYVVKFDNTGNWIWTKYFNYPGTLTSLESTKDHGYALSGYYKVNDTTDRARLIKIDQEGNLQWEKLYGFGHSANSNFVAQTSDSGYILTGRRDTFQLANTIVIKTDFNGNTSPWVNVNNLSEAISMDFILYQNFPNPFNPTTNIKLGVPNAGNVTLKIYNQLGKEVSILVNGAKSPGTYEVTFDASSFGSGIYFYKLEADGFTATKKMILVK